jgi:antitoxin VapB
MKHAKVFKSGNSQAVRLPKDFRFSSNEVEIFKQNGDIILREIPCHLSKAFELLSQLPDDFYADERQDLPPQERETF